MFADGRGLVSQAGAVLLWETMRVTGLGADIQAAIGKIPAAAWTPAYDGGRAAHGHRFWSGSYASRYW